MSDNNIGTICHTLQRENFFLVMKYFNLAANSNIYQQKTVGLCFLARIARRWRDICKAHHLSNIPYVQFNISIDIISTVIY